MFAIEEIHIDSVEAINALKKFLNHFDLEYESDIDYSIAVYDNGRLIATASKAKNVLKCFAILEAYQGLGLTNSLVKKIEDRMFLEGLYHFFIFTPNYNKKIFESIGYKEVITSHNITILENGNQEIKSFLNTLKTKHQLNDAKKACIVMNGNPFTLGHLYLIEKAASLNEELLVFVVKEDKSSFPFEVRYRLIKEGCQHLMNVTVLETGPYLISQATFPTYFLKKDIDVVKLQTKIDCDIFIQYYKTIFNIDKRYVGTEPYCEVTSTYNEVMKEILPKNGVLFIEIDRRKTDGDYISASKVRALIKEDEFEEIRKYVPEVTFNYLTSIEAKKVISKIKENKGRH